jgi:hypothetical protein
MNAGSIKSFNSAGRPFMHEGFSRRALIAGLAVTPILPSQASEQLAQPDAELVALGHQFDELAAFLHYAGWGDDAAVTRFAAVERAILDCEAVTVEGLSVKARAACWARLGDLDPSIEPTTDKRMAISIIRDLIRVHAPHLERPGALKKLVPDIE